MKRTRVHFLGVEGPTVQKLRTQYLCFRCRFPDVQRDHQFCPCCGAEIDWDAIGDARMPLLAGEGR